MRVFHLLQVAHSALFRAADQRSRRVSGLTTSQLAMLLILRKQDGQPITEIAATLAMGKSSLTGLVERLAEKGLISRTPSRKDGRVTLISLTPAGQTVAEAALHDTRHYNKQLLAPFTPDEVQIIRRFLRHIERNAGTIINAAEPPGQTPDGGRND
ncbi:MarR family transcriptional regulator [Thalassovita sp.]|uniref:MarR family winged helix-turn-helix transcriptional regulator n=1 Tax=Thalassovita sp. TaxID=1979401 RepID=UPI0029DE8B52|nr:MarR family transcriptional regulator [Thalassovita sp.]